MRDSLGYVHRPVGETNMYYTESWVFIGLIALVLGYYYNSY